MSTKNVALLIVITVFSLSVIVFLYFYGPSRRSFAYPPKVVSVHTTDQIYQVWKSNGLKGRMAICFTRYLNASETKESKEINVSELSLHQSTLRKITHVTPDSSWPEIEKTLSERNIMRATPEGFIGVLDDGRVYIMPLSRFTYVAEKSLIIVEPKVWTRAQLLQIVDKLKSGKLSSDLIVIIRGSDEDADLFRQALVK